MEGKMMMILVIIYPFPKNLNEIHKNFNILHSFSTFCVGISLTDSLM